jgi:DNA-binding PadR family transcriptional regulator
MRKPFFMEALRLRAEIDVEYLGKRVRKYYTLTEVGRSWTEQKVDEFFDFVNTLTHVLKPTPA